MVRSPTWLFVLLAVACNPKRKPDEASKSAAVTPEVPAASASSKAPADRPAASVAASASPPVAAREFPKRSTTAWPLGDCEQIACKLADGTPGLKCNATQTCFNPCPSGMAVDKGGTYCTKVCKKDSDCGADKCSPQGVCDRWPPELKCQSPEFCDEGGVTGHRCSPRDKCVSPCKRGLVLTGGTHCAKPCKADGECPGGWCEEGVCIPLCPSEGCPYRWE
jgi:hypothetical protein